MTEEIKLDPIKGTLFKKIKKPRIDKGKPRKGCRMRTLKKIWKLAKELL